jgi:hypothetical protein
LTAAELLSRCRALGIDLAAGPDGHLCWEADAEPPAELLAALAERKGELLGLLAGPTPAGPGPAPGRCPNCRRPLDAKARCWRCCDRACESCGRPTGSAFIALCLLCECRVAVAT